MTRNASLETFRASVTAERPDSLQVEHYGVRAWLPKSLIERLHIEPEHGANDALELAPSGHLPRSEPAPRAEITIPGWLYRDRFDD